MVRGGGGGGGQGMRESDGRSVRGQRGWGDGCGRKGESLARCVTHVDGGQIRQKTTNGFEGGRGGREAGS